MSGLNDVGIILTPWLWTAYCILHSTPELENKFFYQLYGLVYHLNTIKRKS